MITQTVSRYRIFKSLDKGEIGEVYLARCQPVPANQFYQAQIQQAQAAGHQTLVEWIAQEGIQVQQELNNSGGKCIP